ncbi:MAG: hypothetical protein DRO23_10780 [Thermoprotei archaeon]|nr:MAG: hypothetical protein DRO23_10780 [Thermoprotei archaeon]
MSWRKICETCPFENYCFMVMENVERYGEPRDIEEALRMLAITRCRTLLTFLVNKYFVKLFHRIDVVNLLNRVYAGDLTAVVKLMDLVEKAKYDVFMKIIYDKPVRPPSWGQEIETNPRVVKTDFREFTREYLKGGYDGSGPWEFSIGPYPVSYFPFEGLLSTNDSFDIEPLFAELGCHLHYRPASVTNNAKNVEKWKLAVRNTYVLILLMPRLLCYFDEGKGIAFRNSVLQWASYSPYQYSETFADNDRYYWLLHDWLGRNYEAVTLNRNRKRTLTIEIRVCETHPIKAWMFTRILQRTVAKKTHVARIVDFDKAKRFYRRIVKGNYTIDHTFTLEEVGLKSNVLSNTKVYSFKTIAEAILKKFKLDEMTKEIVRYAYENRLSRNSDFKKLYEEVLKSKFKV